MHWLLACASTFGAGFLYFLPSIPGGQALGLPLWLAALSAWLGYSSGSIAAFLLNEKAQTWLTTKLRIDPRAENPPFILRMWKRHGLLALGLLAPITVGPQGGALLAKALGARALPIIVASSLGALPTVLIIATLTVFGVKLFAK